MASILSPQTQAHPQAHSAASKRKHASIEGQSANGIPSTNKAHDTALSQDTHSPVRDLIDVLRSQDTTPSILSRALPERSDSTDPQLKRQKSETSSILSRLSANAYATFDDVLRDIDAVVADVLSVLNLDSIAGRNSYTPLPIPDLRASGQIMAFKQRAHELVAREKASDKLRTDPNKSETAYSVLVNGGVASVTNGRVPAATEGKTVLTLYGNAPGPKQLFSGMQKPLNGLDQTVFPPLREAGLPNGISTTKIIPVHATGLLEENKRVRTLGEAFPTPASVPSLQPPKQSKVASSRASTLGWYQPESIDVNSRSSSYFRQPISTGLSLDYSKAINSPESQRKQDRSMNVHGSLIDDSKHSEAAEFEALFRSAYSGFAPTKDDAAAVVPEGVMNKLWWQQNGQKNFERIVENACNLDEAISSEPSSGKAGAMDEQEFERIREAVESFGQEAIDPSLGVDDAEETSIEDKGVEEVLQGISELLETLNAFQRSRHMSLTSSRPTGPLAQDTRSSGTPARPSESEQATYEIIKSQLALMVAMLPPYAVAKLNSDQLAELSISTKIEVSMQDHQGILEEDEVAARAKLAAMNSASSRPPANPPMHRSGSNQLYGNQYSATRPGLPQPAQYFAQTPIRPPQTNMQRPPPSAQIYQPQPQRAPSAAPYRAPAYPGTAYPHQVPRPAQAGPQYPNQAQVYNHTTPTQGYARPVGPPYQNTPQSGVPSGVPTGVPSGMPSGVRYPSQPHHPYPPQAQQQNGANYAYANGNNMNRQGSPTKPMYNGPANMSHPQAQAQNRTPYGTPQTAMPQDRRAYMQGQNLPNGTPSRSPQNQHAMPHFHQHQQQHAQLGPTNYNTFMTTEQQANMMERQRAQLAQQQGTQQQARTAAQATTMSPSKQVNGVTAGP